MTASATRKIMERLPPVRGRYSEDAELHKYTWFRVGVAILHGDTAVSRHGIRTFGSRSQAVGATALKVAAGKVRAKMAKFAATMLEAQEADIVFEDQKILVKNVPESALAFRDVAAYAYIPKVLPRDTEPGLSEEAFWEPEGTNFPFGCYIVQVEIDRDTGEIEIQRLVGVDDCGVVINPLIVAGQVHGGLAQGIGQALFEEVVYDEDGQPLVTNYMNYLMPTASDVPLAVKGEIVTPSPFTPLGAKGCGEGAIHTTPATILCAINDALAPLGKQATEVPASPMRIWNLLRDVSE